MLLTRIHKSTKAFLHYLSISPLLPAHFSPVQVPAPKDLPLIRKIMVLDFPSALRFDWPLCDFNGGTVGFLLGYKTAV